MEALRNLRNLYYDLIDLRSVRDVSMRDEIYEEVGPPRNQGPIATEAQQGPVQGGNQR